MTKKNKVKGQGEVSMSLYEINKNIISQMPEYDNEKLKELKDKINAWEKQSNNYFMLLCNNIHYYTILFRNHSTINDFCNLGHATIGVLLESNYTIHSEEECGDHFEIWAKKDNEVYDFLLFPYDQGVVNYG